jgi:hypothetical protein
MVMTLLAPGIGVAKLPPNVRNECFSIVKDSIDDFLVHGAVSKLNTDGSYSSVVDLSIRNCYSFGLNFFTGCHEDDPSMKLRALLDSSLPSVIQKFTSHYLNGKVAQHQVLEMQVLMMFIHLQLLKLQMQHILY